MRRHYWDDPYRSIERTEMRRSAMFTQSERRSIGSQLIERDGGFFCFYCKAPLDGSYHIDHKTPYARGGAHHLGQLRFGLPSMQSREAQQNPRRISGVAARPWRGGALLVGKLAAGSRAAISASRSVQRKRAPILPSFVRLTKAKLDSPKVGQWNFLALGTRLPCVVHTLNYSDRFIFHRRAICLRTNWDRSMRRNNHDRVSITCGRDNIAHVTLKCWFKIFFDDGCNYVPVTMRRRVGI